MTLYLRGTGKVRDYAQTLLPVVVASVPLYTPVVAVLVIAYEDVSPWTLPLFLTPALAAQRLFAMYQEQRRLAEDLRRRTRRWKRRTSRSPRLSSRRWTQETSTPLDTRQQSRSTHATSLRGWALSEAAQQEAHLAGLVHDIGKIGLPPGLLEKEGPLTLEERRVMQTHSEIGEGILGQGRDL